ncbi:DUF3558 domain-containing protein [Allokutzneria oryzae]|uniref:DUF3558 domain-containing protein n=1 Tax=Allokutzneria oryzae TaxID=1378989 RepID=A0ABV6A2G2_9PSEU
MPIKQAAATIAASVLLLSACSTPEPEPAANPITPTRAAHNDAPSVRTPLNTERFQRDPCAVLTEVQAVALRLNPRGENTENPLAPQCSWSNDIELTNFALHFNTANPKGLQNLYDKKRDDNEIHLERIPDIQDHPAIIFTSTPELLSKGECGIAVGVSDQLTFAVTNSIPDGPERAHPCESARKFADAVLTTMKKG